MRENDKGEKMIHQITIANRASCDFCSNCYYFNDSNQPADKMIRGYTWNSASEKGNDPNWIPSSVEQAKKHLCKFCITSLKVLFNSQASL